MDDCVHTPNDGRGVRDVFVDGKLVDHAFYADEREGIVKAYEYPFRIEGDCLVIHTLRGKVEVKPHEVSGD